MKRSVTLPKTRWSEEKRAALQRPNGTYDHKRLARTIINYRRKGWLLIQIAHHTRIPLQTLHSCSSLSSLIDTIKEDCVLLIDLLEATGLKRTQNLRTRAIRMGLPLFYIGQQPATNDEGAQALIDHYTQPRDAQTAAAWWSSVQAAQHLGLKQDAFIARVHAAKPPFDQVRRCRFIAPTGTVWRYDPDSIRQVAACRPVAPRTAPAGTLTSLEVCTLLGLSRSAPKLWAGRGAPHGRTSQGHGNFYFYPEKLADWLAQQPRPYHRSMARTLRAATQQEGAA